MNATQATLPLVRDLPAAGALHAPAHIADAVEYREVGVREALAPCANDAVPFAWTLDPYRGRATGRAFEPEHRVLVRRGAAAALRRRLRESDLRGQSIALGAAGEPYPAAELRFGITRELLATLGRAEGLDLSILTRSPLVLRDLDLLRRIDRRNAVTVRISLATLDGRLAQRLEGVAPSPQRRLDAAARLSEAGIATALVCSPLMPGINAGSRHLLPIFEAARDSGVFDVLAEPLTLPLTSHPRFGAWLRREFPALARRYRRLYRRRSGLRPADRDRLLEIYRRLRLELGFPRPAPGL